MRPSLGATQGRGRLSELPRIIPAPYRSNHSLIVLGGGEGKNGKLGVGWSGKDLLLCCWR